jgi:hypothetical protein
LQQPAAVAAHHQPPALVAHFLATLAWAGCTLRDEGGRLVVRDDRGGLLQREVDKRAAAIRAWWQVTGEVTE